MSRAPLAEETLLGQAAAPGCVEGVIHHLAPRPWQVAPREAPSPAAALDRFDRAVGAAAHAEPSAPLADPAFLAAVRAAIAGGEPALSAFVDGLDLWCTDKDLPLEDFTTLRHALAAALGTEEAARRATPAEAIVLAQDLTPTRFLEIDWQKARGLALGEGDSLGHVALLARARGLPLLVGLGAALKAVEDGIPAILDGDAGILVLKPQPDKSALYRPRIADWAAQQQDALQSKAGPARTADGTAIAITLNVDSLQSLETILPAACDGIGLVRSEFLLPAPLLRDEAGQYRLYRALLFWAEGRPVTIRTLDAGGDKPVPGLSEGAEAAGLRGLALTLAHPDIFRVQLRALARAAGHGDLRMLLPGVTTPEQVTEARLLLEQAVAALQAEGQMAALPPLGIMVETEPALRNLSAFGAVFFAIGSNDLERRFYRKSEKTTPDRRIVETIKMVCRLGQAKGIPVSLCGELASRPEAIPNLLKAGLRALSVPPAAIATVKQTIAGCRL